MRIGAFLLAMVGLGMLIGCGGGGGAAPSTEATLAGTWLDVAPSGAAVAPTERGIGWPSRQLTMDEAGNFQFEDTVTASRVQGRYRLAGETVRFTRLNQSGAPVFFSDAPVGFAFFDKYLAISEQTHQGILAMQLSKHVTRYPAHMNTEWVLVRLLTGEGADLPCTTAARLVINADATVALTTYAMADGKLVTTPGTMLVTQSGHTVLRVNRISGGGESLLVLGKTGIDTNGSMVTIGPAGTRCLYTARQAPPVDLIGVWEWNTETATYRMTLNANGTYQEESPAGVETGQWHTYANRTLALTATSPQARLRICGWTIKLIAGIRVLTAREWALQDGTPVIRESSWKLLP